jgi:hypothetical protein
MDSKEIDSWLQLCFSANADSRALAWEIYYGQSYRGELLTAFKNRLSDIVFCNVPKPEGWELNQPHATAYWLTPKGLDMSLVVDWSFGYKTYYLRYHPESDTIRFDLKLFLTFKQPAEDG